MKKFSLMGFRSIHGALVAIMLTIPLAASGTGIIDEGLLREGDIIFQETSSFQGKAVKLATHSRFTHVGIIFKYDGKFMVLEAVHPVRITKPGNFVKRGIGGSYVIKRLRNHKSVLGDSVIGKMKDAGKAMIGKHYDLYFEWNDKRIYCTELVWKLYKDSAGIEVGKLQRIRDLDLSHPLVKYMMFKRYGKNIPYDEPVITPQSMFEADDLETVLEKN